MKFLVALALLPAVSFQLVLVDKTCTLNGGTGYDASAINCSNVMTDADCQAVYPGPAVDPTYTAERPRNCFSLDGLHLYEAYKTAAVFNCPKTCGYCCIAPKPPSSECADLWYCAGLEKYCTDPYFEEAMAEQCAKTCGKCPTYTPCVDTEAGCSYWAANSFCTSTFYTSAQKKQYCAKTCGLC